MSAKIICVPRVDALRSQIAPVEEFLERSEIRLWRVPGEEADDVLASLAAHGAGEIQETLIISADKDLFQVVTEAIGMVSPAKMEHRFGPVEVMAKTGVAPEQIVDWLALTGDGVDNIPGVPGLGPKTAAKLLAEHGSLDGLWLRIESVASERIRQALLAHRSVVERNQALIRLRRDMPCALDWERTAVRSESPERMLPFYREMEFHTLARPLEEQTLL